MTDSSIESTLADPVRANGSEPIKERYADISEDDFLAHYFKRIDPKIAETFTAEQRSALLSMFGGRGIARHSFEYLVFLLGRERRAYERLFSEGEISSSFTWLGYLATAALWLAPVVLLAVVLQMFFGISLLP
jgi:hypothetical protein